MSPFTYVAVTQQGKAIDTLRANPHAKFLAGGTNLIDEMKLNVQQPTSLIDINDLPLNKIEPLPDGGLRIGAMVRNSELAYDERVMRQYPVLSEALLSGASAQLRNMASTAGNLLQHTRCSYYRDTSYPCNKRNPGAGCCAIGGFNRMHAILGTSDQCIATHPSDMCVALAALDAVVEVRGTNGTRHVPLTDLHRLPGDTPEIETELAPGDLITAVELPAKFVVAPYTAVIVCDPAPSVVIAYVVTPEPSTPAAPSSTCPS